MKKTVILGKDFTVQEQKSEKDIVVLRKNRIVVESHQKTGNSLLKEYLIDLLYTQVFEIYDEIKQDGKIEILGNVEFEVVEKIDNKKERLAKLKVNKILVKLKAISLPKEALKYVIAHEIAHIFTKKHTEKFWKTVETIHPNYKAGQNLLIKYRNLLTK